MHFLNFYIDWFTILSGLGVLFSFLLVLRHQISEDMETWWKVLIHNLILHAAFVYGTKLELLFLYPKFYLNHIDLVFDLKSPGSMLWAGIFSALLSAALTSRLLRLDYLRWADAFAPGMLLGIAFGRVGCFVAKCCAGKELGQPLGQMTHYPTQLLATFFALLGFTFIWRFRSRFRMNGQLFFLAIIWYGITRWPMEYLRADYRGPALLEWLYPAHYFGLAAVLIFAFILKIRKKIIRPESLLNH